jgi:dienelactone hydrolase
MTDSGPAAGPSPGGRLVAVPGGDVELAALLYEHPGRPRPAVVMTHGLSATIRGMVADRYAEVIHAAGLNVLLVEHRGFGLSGGEPRQQIGRWIQMGDYRDGLDYVSRLASVDPDRLAVWGDSYSAAVAIGVAAFDDRVRAAVVQVPACGSTPPPPDPDGATFRMHRDVYRDGPSPATPDLATDRQPVVSFDQRSTPSILEPITAFRWFIDYGGRPGTGWLNWASGRAPDLPVAFHAGLAAPHLRGSSLWVIAGDDEMPGAEPDIARAAFESAPEPKELVLVDSGHFGLLYHPSELFDRVSEAQASFLARTLLAGAR